MEDEHEEILNELKNLRKQIEGNKVNETKEKYYKLKEKALEKKEEAESYIRDNPMKTIMIATLSGVFIGMILSGIRHRNYEC